MADEGKTGGKQIAHLEKGNTTRTALHSSVMNEMIDALNAQRNGRVTIQATTETPSGRFIFSESNWILELKLGNGIPTAPTSDTWVLGSINGVVQWLTTTDCAGIDGGGA